VRAAGAAAKYVLLRAGTGVGGGTLQATLEALEPQPLGRPAKPTSPEQAEMESLKAELCRMQRELELAQVQLGIAQIHPGLLPKQPVTADVAYKKTPDVLASSDSSGEPPAVTLRRFRRVWQHQNQRLIHRLRWRRPGTVWAVDHLQPDRPIDGKYPHALSVRDLASHDQLAWEPVPDADAETTIAVLASLFWEHGPPWSSRATTDRPSSLKILATCLPYGVYCTFATPA